MLREAGADYVIIGHSERRRLFGETDETVNRKLVAALGAKLTAIVCIGETLDEREGNQTLDVLDRQIKVGLDGMTGEQVAGLVIAYEPVWAIGTGRNATPAQAGEAHAHIRGGCGSGSAAMRPTTATSSTAAASSRTISTILCALPDVDGALVGGASLEVRAFYDIVAEAGRARYNRSLCSTTSSRRCTCVTCLLLLLVVLLQQGKGGDMASAFGGGGSQTAFGARAGATVLTRATTVLGVLFMLGAIVLGIIGRQGPGSIMQGVGGPAPQAAPAAVPSAPTTTQAPAPAPPTQQAPVEKK